MKKQLFPLLFSLCLVVLLGSLLFYMLTSLPLPSSGEQEPQTAAPVLLQLSGSQVNTISIATPHQSFLLSNLGDSLSIEGWEEIPLDPQRCQELMDTLAYLPAVRPLGRLNSLSSEQLKLYGLDFPSHIIQISPVAAAKITLQIGFSPNEKETFVALGESVFSVLTQNLTPFLYSKNQFVSCDITPSLPVSLESGAVSLGGSVRPKTVSIAFSPQNQEDASFGEKTPSPNKTAFPFSQYQFSLTAPVKTNLPTDSARPIISSLYNLTADKVALVHPTSSQLRQLGLNAPYATARTNVDGQGFSLIASPVGSNGSVYVMNQSVPIVYQVQAENIPWLTAQYEVLSKAAFFTGNPQDVRQVQITSPNLSYTFYLWKGETTCNGQLLPQGKFDEFYTKVLSIPPASYTWETPVETTPLVTVQITYTDSSRPTDTLALLPYTAKEAFLSFNEEVRFVVSRACAQNILDNCQNILDRKPLKIQ